MPILVISSPKGGVGKTMITASLAVALRALGWEVMALDFDPQNSLKLHFGLEPLSPQGWGQQFLAGGPWQAAIEKDRHNIQIVPFGLLSADMQVQLVALFPDRQRAFAAELAAWAGQPDHVLLVDTSPGHGLYADFAVMMADWQLVVLVADAASYAALTASDRGDSLTGHPRQVCVINQFNPASRLARDGRLLIEGRTADGLIGVIQKDESVAEALAFGQTVPIHDPDCKASRDIAEITLWLDQHLDQAAPRPAIRARAGP